MRQRNIKNLDERIEENSRFLVENPRSCKGRWHEVFGNDYPIFLEIGCGKGRFIEAHAQRETSCNFIACEGQASVVLRALEKQRKKDWKIFVFLSTMSMISRIISRQGRLQVFI